MLLFETRMGWLEVVIEKHSPQMPNRWAFERPSINEIIVDAGKFSFMFTSVKNKVGTKPLCCKLALAIVGAIGVTVTAAYAATKAAPWVLEAINRGVHP
jgi:hypothetical protein